MSSTTDRLRAVRNRTLWYALRGGQRLGIDVTPHHFYSNVPDLRALSETSYWRRPRSMTGVAGADLKAQIAELSRWVSPEQSAAIARQDLHAEACASNGEVGYGRIEAELFYAFLASNRPRTIVQIGSGVSTAIALKAKQDFNLESEVVCIDPYPTHFLRAAAARGLITLLAEPAQTVAMETSARLSAGDLLFVDSTHTVKVGSEVNDLILDVLPSLNPGVFVHFHDIYFPYDYVRDILDGAVFFWNESVLLHAFLIGNQHAAIRVSASMLHHGAPEALSLAFPHYRPQRMTDGLADPPGGPGDFPSSLYLEIL